MSTSEMALDSVVRDDAVAIGADDQEEDATILRDAGGHGGVDEGADRDRGARGDRGG